MVACHASHLKLIARTNRDADGGVRRTSPPGKFPSRGQTPVGSSVRTGWGLEMHLPGGSHGRRASWAGQGPVIRRGAYQGRAFHIKSPMPAAGDRSVEQKGSLQLVWRSCQRGPGVRLLHSQAPWGSSAVFPCWPWPQRHVSHNCPAPDGSASGHDADRRQSSRQHGHSRRQRSCTRTQRRESYLIHGPSPRLPRTAHGPLVPPSPRMPSQRMLQSSSAT